MKNGTPMGVTLPGKKMTLKAVESSGREAVGEKEKGTTIPQEKEHLRKSFFTKRERSVRA